MCVCGGVWCVGMGVGVCSGCEWVNECQMA